MWKVHVIALYNVALLGAREIEGSIIILGRKSATRKYTIM
jgi:hypothetical protein